MRRITAVFLALAMMVSASQISVFAQSTDFPETTQDPSVQSAGSDADARRVTIGSWQGLQGVTRDVIVDTAEGHSWSGRLVAVEPDALVLHLSRDDGSTARVPRKLVTEVRTRATGNGAHVSMKVALGLVCGTLLDTLALYGDDYPSRHVAAHAVIFGIGAALGSWVGGKIERPRPSKTLYRVSTAQGAPTR